MVRGTFVALVGYCIIDCNDCVVRALAAVKLKSYNAIFAPSIYQKSLVAVEAKL